MHVMYSIGPAGVGVIICLIAFAAYRIAGLAKARLRLRAVERRLLEHNPSTGVSPEGRLFLDVLEGRLQRQQVLQLNGGMQAR